MSEYSFKSRLGQGRVTVKNALSALLRVGLVLALCMTVLVGAGSAASANQETPCDPDAVASFRDFMLETGAKIAESGALAFMGKMLSIADTVECAQWLGVFDLPKFGVEQPRRQPGSGPEAPAGMPHPKTDGYRLPCLGPNGEQWEIWSDEVCRGPNGQTG